MHRMECRNNTLNLKSRRNSQFVGVNTLFVPKTFFITSAFAAFHVSLQLPALVAGALDAGFFLLAPLAALQVFGTEALDLAGLVVCSQFHTQGARAHEALPRNNAAVVATATVVQRTQV